MTIKLKEKIKMGTLIHINYPNICNKDNIKVIEVLQNLYKNLDRRINLKTAIYNSVEKGRGVKLTGLFYGNSIDAREILSPLENITNSMEIKIEDMSILECNRYIQDSHPDYEKYKSTGRFIYKDYNYTELKRLIEIIDNPAEGANYTAISFYGAGGAISDVDKLDTAYYYRGAKFIMGIQSVWEEDKYADINKEWLKENFKTIELMTIGSFVNFPLHELNSYEDEYYGENIIRLKEIKKNYDPYNIFNYPQVIRNE